MAQRSLSRRMVMGLGAVGLASGCGFTPVYAPGAKGTDLRGRLLPDPAASRDGFVFVAEIEDRLGRAPEGDLRLAYALSLREERLALSPSGSDLRIAVVGRVTFQVLDSSGAILTQGSTDGSTSFTDRGTSIAVRTARADARRRAAIILADRTADRLIASAPAWLP